jgi:phosphate transport system substrate-binding protein
MWRRVWRVVGMITASALLASCGNTTFSATNTPTVSQLEWGVTHSMSPLAQDVANTYLRTDELFVITLQENNWRGVERFIAADPTHYGLTSYLPEDTTFWAAKIGEDGVAVIVNAAITVPVLTATQLRQIFTGQVENWSTVGGDDLPLIPVSREDGAASREVFQRVVLGDRPLTLNARLAPTSAAMLQIVRDTPGAIGYLSFGWLDGSVRAVPLAAAQDTPPIVPSLINLANQSYPLRTPILLVGQRPPAQGTLIHEFFVWLQQGEGQQLIGQTYAPVLR